MYRSMGNKSKLIFTPLDRPMDSELSRGVIPGIKRVHRPKMIRNKLFVQNWCFTLLRAGIVTGAQRHWMELNPFSTIRGGKFFFLSPFWHGTILGPFILLIVSGHGVFHAKHHRPDVDGYPGGLFDGDDDYNADGTKLSIFFFARHASACISYGSSGVNELMMLCLGKIGDGMEDVIDRCRWSLNMF